MPPDDATKSHGRATPASRLIVECVVVGSVLVSLSATFIAVVLYVRAGAKAKPAEVVAEERPPQVIAAVPAPEKKQDLQEPAPEPPPSPPDTSAEEARSLDQRIAEAHKAKARADLLAWSAEAAAKWLESRTKSIRDNANKAVEVRGEAQIMAEQTAAEASMLADAVARLELTRDDAAARLEAARNRKGYSILPYRGPNGAWQRPLPIECSLDTAQIMPGGPSFRLIDLELSGISRNSIFARIVELATRKAAAQATPDGDAPTVYVLFVVRPSGIKAYYEARARLQAQGVAFGYELVDESTPIDYPDLGDLSEWPGYVPPQELADALTPGGGASAGTGSGTGVGAGNGGEPGVPGAGNGTGTEGLFVWKEGLDGARPKRMGTGAGQSSEVGEGVGAGAGGTEPGESGKPGNDANASPRVDFGPGSLSQLGRGRGGSTLGDGRSQIPSLEPPWGARPDPRRGEPTGTGTTPRLSNGAESGKSPGSSGSGVQGGAGTFEDLVAELAAQGEMGSPKSLTRPGAVAILPGDLADDSLGSSRNAGGSFGESGNVGGLSGDTSELAGQGSRGTRSPFGTSPPTLPRFEPAPSSADAASNPKTIAGSQPASGATASSADSSAGSPSGSAGSVPPMSSAAGGGMPAGASGGRPPAEAPRQGLRGGLRRLFGGEERLPEKTWEVSLTCDADGLTVRPGEHRLSLNDLQNDPDLLPRTLQSMFERHVRENPERYWRPYVKYRIAAGGEGLMGLSQNQLAQGFVRWPAVVEPVAAVPPANSVPR